jgi:hypothetical protein
MRIRLLSPSRPAGGYALLMVLGVTAACLVILAATISRTASNAGLNDRNCQYVASLYASEAATEKVLARMKYDFARYNLAGITNNLSIYQSYVPTSTEDPYWANFQFSDGSNNLNKTYVQCVYSTGFGPLQSSFTGLNGWTNIYRIVSNARQTNTRYAITNAVQQEILLAQIPVFQFAIFYNSLLEFTTCAPLTINGRTHANSNIFVGSSSTLTFNSTVTTTGAIMKTNWAGRDTSSDAWPTYNGNPQYTAQANALALPIGTNTSYNTPNAVREVLNMPPAGEAVDSQMGQVRYYNQAEVVLLVSNATVTAMLKTSPSDTPTNIVATFNPINYDPSNYVAITTNFPFLTVTNVFTDLRENDLVKVTQIDVGKYNSWLITNRVAKTKFPSTSGVYASTSTVPNILYVADNRTNASGQLMAVRLMDATVVPTNMVNWGAASNQPSGFTVATPNPLYVMGSYNCPDPTAISTTNTSKTFPCALAADAITILSTNWQDALNKSGSATYSDRPAADTTINAAILAGVVYSTGPAQSQYSGGAHNLTRLLENWSSGSGQTLTLNTSLVNLFNSVRATGSFKFPTSYYQVPKQRNFNFDMNFLDCRKLPPGTPILPVCIRQKWVVPPPNTVNYAGN